MAAYRKPCYPTFDVEAEAVYLAPYGPRRSVEEPELVVVFLHDGYLVSGPDRLDVLAPR